MRVLIFHGYLLRGTGSNVYNASLAAALAAAGYEVHLVCQDREAGDLAPPGAAGSVTIHNPEIGGLLPVFVHDAYEGFEARTFPELTDAEIERYIALNVEAVRELVAELGGVDAALANHLIMGPLILARAGLSYALKVHGSDLSYSILPNLERFRPYAQEACDGAAGILVGSGHIAERLRLAVDDPATNAKVRLGPPGVDTALFAPVALPERRAHLVCLSERLRSSTADAAQADDRTRERSAWSVDADRAVAAIEWFAEAEGPRIVFVGKLIISKGVDLLLASWPLVHATNPAARLLIVGFGAAEEPLRDLWEGLAGGELGPLRDLAARGRGVENGEEAPLEMLGAFLASLPDDYAENARGAAGSVEFAGRLEHAEVGGLLPGADALVFPSTFPEAFGMVAAEAASAGALPVSAGHSGAAEVSRELARRLPAGARELVSFPLGEEAVESIASRLNGWLALDPGRRAEASAALRATVEDLWSWEGVARAVLMASSGELASFPGHSALDTHETSSRTRTLPGGADE